MKRKKGYINLRKLYLDALTRNDVEVLTSQEILHEDSL